VAARLRTSVASSATRGSEAIVREENERLVRAAYAAQAAGDVDGYLDLLAEDFRLTIPGGSPIAGEYQGREDMRRHFREIRDISEGSFRTAIHDVLASDDHAVGLVDASAARAGQAWSIPRVHVWHAADGRLAELWIHPADQARFDRYWSGSA
jgi:uncharacterized protein